MTEIGPIGFNPNILTEIKAKVSTEVEKAYEIAKKVFQGDDFNAFLGANPHNFYAVKEIYVNIAYKFFTFGENETGLQAVMSAPDRWDVLEKVINKLVWIRPETSEELYNKYKHMMGPNLNPYWIAKGYASFPNTVEKGLTLCDSLKPHWKCDIFQKGALTYAMAGKVKEAMDLVLSDSYKEGSSIGECSAALQVISLELAKRNFREEAEIVKNLIPSEIIKAQTVFPPEAPPPPFPRLP